MGEAKHTPWNGLPQADRDILVAALDAFSKDRRRKITARTRAAFLRSAIAAEPAAKGGA